MENRAHALAAGLFTLILGVALVAAAFWIRGEPIAHDAYVLHTRGSVTGLNAQAPVRYRGVEVGKVETIAFDPADPRVILVQIQVKSGTPLTRGTYGQLAAQGVTGLSYVQLNDDGSSNELRDPSNAAQARIELKPSFLERFTDSGEQLVARMVGVTRQLEAWLSEDNRQQAARTLVAVETAAQRFSALAESAEPGMKAVPELARQAGTTLKNADALMGDLRGLTATLNQRSEALDRVAVSAERIGASVEKISAAGSTLGTAASRETLPRLNVLLEEISRSSRSLERLIEELSANPSSLVFGKSPPVPGPGEPGFAHGAAR
jgi:phospholipid/cholesterol/gamma-HCH transport system substrate-binding protein